MLKKIVDVIFGRMIFIVAAFIIQLVLIFIVIFLFRDYLLHFYGLCTFISFCFVLHVIDSECNPSYKISWIVAITAIPILGWIFYRFFVEGKSAKIKYANLTAYVAAVKENLKRNMQAEEKIKTEDKRIYNNINYIYNSLNFPVYDNTEATYFPIGEKMYESLLSELEKAERFIFMEYFIISEGEMWNGILKILERKAEQGVDVRIIFDDLGCLFTLPVGYRRELESKKIKCAVFNKVGFILTLRYNNRTHRKFTVIDGKTAYTGGLNISDEYINITNNYGHWKDTAVMIKGSGVYSFTIMFLCFWAFLKKEYEDDYEKYVCNDFGNIQPSGYVVPFTDTPLDDEAAGENVYINDINNAVDYVYITTPYLILDNEMMTALCNAAKKGVDVRIITPHIPDKKAVFSVTRANYVQLVRNGVRIFEYTPGFIHAKNFVSDDRVAVVGTINLDYRSFYLHFECALWMYKVDAIKDIKEDFINTQKLSKEITIDDINRIKKSKSIYRRILKLLAPLM